MTKHIFISGRVQGVGFRHFTKTNARKLGIKGWVKNLPDGRVEAVFEGGSDEVQKLIEKCRQGPPAGKVKELKVNEEEQGERFKTFEVRY